MGAELEDYSRTLAEEGIVVVEGYLDDEICDDLYRRISESIELGEFDVAEGKYSYSDLANWGDVVVDKRTGRDEGMYDVFNIDEEIGEVRSIKEDSFINDIVDRAASVPYSPDNINVYWNRSVTTTRDFHADTYSGKFKSFVYLTDVPDLSYGPFSFIKGSHETSKAKQKVSQLINRFQDNPPTDAVFYDDENVVRCTAPKGTLIIANQAGYHRGHPQEEGRERMLVTTSYTPE